MQFGIPFVFCVIISMLAMFMGENAMPAFYAFLPMCFLFVASPMVVMNKRIEQLEQQLEQLKR